VPGFPAGANCKSVITVIPTRRNIRALTIASVKWTASSFWILVAITLARAVCSCATPFAADRQGQKELLLNMGEVNYIDSSGLGELVSAYTTAKNQQAEVKLLKLTRKVHIFCS